MADVNDELEYSAHPKWKKTIFRKYGWFFESNLRKLISLGFLCYKQSGPKKELWSHELDKEYRACYVSPIGPLEITGTDKGVKSLRFTEKKFKSDSPISSSMKDCLFQLDEYFKGKRQTFNVKLLLQGTEFQKKVWKQLMQIPYAKTLSYKEVAQATGNVKAVRAVGGANGRNPVGIIIPCHRVIAHDGTLGGYGGGLWRKEWLLNHEKKAVKP